ncbi:hypothetical protein D3C72_496650 [compost metagenome]
MLTCFKVDDFVALPLAHGKGPPAGWANSKPGLTVLSGRAGTMASVRVRPEETVTDDQNVVKSRPITILAEDSHERLL